MSEREASHPSDDLEPFSSFKTRLSDWTDSDYAAFFLAQSIGLMKDVNFPRQAKGVFWSDNPLGNALHRMLMELVDAGVLEYREEPDYQFRWNAQFVGTGNHAENQSQTVNSLSQRSAQAASGGHGVVKCL